MRESVILGACISPLGSVIPLRPFPFQTERDDVGDQRLANRAVAVSAVGLAVTGMAELAIAVLTG